MRKLLGLIVCIGLIHACNNETKKEETVVKEASHEQAHEERLTLNDGAKWNSDESTNQNVASMQQIISAFKKNEAVSIENYVSVANELQSGLDKMIKECRMKGADHDALHLWLEPLIKDVKELKKANDAGTASNVFGKIEKQVLIYNNYFE